MYLRGIDRFLRETDWRNNDIIPAILGRKMFDVVCFRSREPGHQHRLGKRLLLRRRPNQRKRNSLSQKYYHRLGKTGDGRACSSPTFTHTFRYGAAILNFIE